MQIAERIIGLIAPHNCLSCGKEGKLLCDWCLPDAAEPIPSRCYRCKQSSPDSQVCQKCRRITRLEHVWIRSPYKGLAKDLIYSLKFGRAGAAALPAARLMSETLPWLPPETLVVHVPTASSRRRQRGYDHAELIAKHLARLHGLKHLSLLSRLGQSRQVGAKRPIRLEQLQKAFRPYKEQLIKGSSILLVDDIVTTGATLEAAAKTLKKAGARSVDAVAFAQKQ